MKKFHITRYIYCVVILGLLTQTTITSGQNCSEQTHTITNTSEKQKAVKEKSPSKDKKRSLRRIKTYTGALITLLLIATGFQLRTILWPINHKKLDGNDDDNEPTKNPDLNQPPESDDKTKKQKTLKLLMQAELLARRSNPKTQDQVTPQQNQNPKPTQIKEKPPQKNKHQLPPKPNKQPNPNQNSGLTPEQKNLNHQVHAALLARQSNTNQATPQKNPSQKNQPPLPPKPKEDRQTPQKTTKGEAWKRETTKGAVTPIEIAPSDHTQDITQALKNHPQLIKLLKKIKQHNKIEGAPFSEIAGYNEWDTAEDQFSQILTKNDADQGRILLKVAQSAKSTNQTEKKERAERVMELWGEHLKKTLPQKGKPGKKRRPTVTSQPTVTTRGFFADPQKIESLTPHQLDSNDIGTITGRRGAMGGGPSEQDDSESSDFFKSLEEPPNQGSQSDISPDIPLK